MGDKKETMGTLIILHGWTYDIGKYLEKWEPFLKILKQKGAKPKVLKIPGLTAPLNQVWTLDDYVYWLAQQVTSHKLPVVILGHSNGGRIATAFSSKYPEKVSRLILIDSAGIIHKDLKTHLNRFLFGTAAKIGKKITNQDSIRNLFYKVVGEQDYYKAGPTLKKIMLNLISQDLEPAFSRINVRTLIIWGKNDIITPLSDGSRIHSLIKNSKFVVIEKAKHSPQFTHPEKTAEIVINFLGNHKL